MKEALIHFEKHRETFKLWIRLKSRLQKSSDILKPLIEPFESETKSVVSCQDCIIDMLVWYSIHLKRIHTFESNEKIEVDSEPITVTPQIILSPKLKNK